MEQKKIDDTIIVVSGLPRSGTSMMMQMLEAGGITIVKDEIRKPDKDNPKGYYEYANVKTIHEDSSWLNMCFGKAVKIVSMLLFKLPKDKKYKIIFLNRDIDEILASQRIMLQRLGRMDDGVSDEALSKKFQSHLLRVEKWLHAQINIKTLFISYNQILKNPYRSVSKVNTFFGGYLKTEKMASVVNKSLYRNRNRSSPEKQSA